jgi:hypothetical protein
VQSFQNTGRNDFGAQSNFAVELSSLIEKYDRAVSEQVANIQSMTKFILEDQKYLENRAEKAKQICISTGIPRLTDYYKFQDIFKLKKVELEKEVASILSS